MKVSRIITLLQARIKRLITLGNRYKSLGEPACCRDKFRPKSSPCPFHILRGSVKIQTRTKHGRYAYDDFSPISSEFSIASLFHDFYANFEHDKFETVHLYSTIMRRESSFGTY